jgi:flagellin-specific chaperone FliS
VPIYEWAIHTLLEVSATRDTAEITPLREVFETLQQGWHGMDATQAGAA